jgi:uncharacterized protein (DUF1015 family)
MQVKPFKAIYPDFDLIAAPDLFCDEAKHLFPDFKQSGFYKQFSQRALYIYQIETSARKHTGLIALDEIEEFFAGKMKKHEKTLDAGARQHLDLLLTWNAILKPILLTYRPVPEVQAFLEQVTRRNAPLFSARFVKNGQTHRIWTVADAETIAHIQALFSTHVHSTYIADGHHRTATIALLHDQYSAQYPEFDFDNLHCAFFSGDQLDIMDYNRVITGVETDPLQLLSKVFDITPLDALRKPAGKFEVCCYTGGASYALRWKQEILDAYPSDTVLLDAALLNERVLRDLFRIENAETAPRILYVEGRKGLEGIVKSTESGPDRIGFALYPVAFEDMMGLADRGESLPPKSTYFEPRLKSGLLVKILSRDGDTVTQKH